MDILLSYILKKKSVMHVVYTYFFNYTIKKEAQKTLWCTKVGIVCTRCLCLAIRLLEPSHDALYLQLSCKYMRQRISKGCHVHRAVAMCTGAGSSISVKVFCQTVSCTGNQDANVYTCLTAKLYWFSNYFRITWPRLLNKINYWTQQIH
jgi:hypothetical protein